MTDGAGRVKYGGNELFTQIFAKMYTIITSFETYMAQKGEHLKNIFNALFHANTINGNDTFKLSKR